MPVSTDTINFKKYLEIFYRRKYTVLAIIVLGLLFAFTYSMLLPPVYRSSTLILVEPQRISTSYVSPTVTTTVQERLSTISQQILSRTNLEKIILQFNLYRDRKTPANEKNWDQLIRWGNNKVKSILGEEIYGKISWAFINDIKYQVPMEVLVEMMRGDIEIKVIGGNSAFSISYIGEDPVLVMKVTNTLAKLFIEENLKIREQQVEGTSEFLANEHAEAKKELEKQEKIIKEFKEKNMGALPEQIDANLRTLDRLQIELQTINDNMKSNEDRKIFYEGQIEDLERESKYYGSGVRTKIDKSGVEEKVRELNENLKRLRAEFNENYPDILIIKNQIRELENQYIQENTQKDASSAIYGRTSQQSTMSSSPQVQTLRLQLKSLASELSSLRHRQQRTIEMIKEYEKRVEGTFTNEQKLLDLSRDYETSQKSYQDLLQKRLAARISENLEKRQKAEQFRIVDSAKVPVNPYKPDRLKIILLAGLASLGLGVGIALVQDFLRPSYRRAEDFRDTVPLPVLATIPTHTVAPGKATALITVEKPESLIAEQYRLLYTRLAQVFEQPKRTVVAISSAMDHEGKTITAMNLALVAARDFGRKTLLIEGDFKSPAFAKYLPIVMNATLYDYLFQKADLQSAILPFAHDNLSLLPFGENAKNSIALLSSEGMRELFVILRERYDLIVVDGPPILSLPDMHIIERLVDGIVLVVRAGKTPREAAVTAIKSLGVEKMVGIVLNESEETIKSYYRYSYQDV